ncbi:MAG: hypothetical protein WDA60_19770 [Acidimicrobiia bacterium]|jgi:hypothetical protein
MTVHVDVLHAELHDQDGRAMWMLETEVTRDGEPPVRLTHVLPADAMAWRAAEYGLDIDRDLDELLEVVLVEPYLDPPAPGADPFRAEQATAREHLRTRVRRARRPGRARAVRGIRGTPPESGALPGARRLLAASDTDDPLDVIRSASSTSRADVAQRRRAFLTHRASLETGPLVGPLPAPQIGASPS